MSAKAAPPLLAEAVVATSGGEAGGGEVAARSKLSLRVSEGC